MDAREFAPTKKIVLIVGAGLVAIVFLFVLVFREETVKQQYYSAQDRLRLYRSDVWHIGKLDETTLQKQLEDQISRFPAKEELASLIQELNDVGKQNNITIDALSPKDSAGVEDLAKTGGVELEKMPFDMRVHGTFQDLSNFVSTLTHLDHGILKIERFDLNPKEAKSQDLGLQLQCMVYLKKAKNVSLFSREEKDVETRPLMPKTRSRFNDIGRNPFSLVDQKQKSKTSLEGIIYDPVKPLAVIGGDIKRLGDQVDGATILEIKQNSVLFEKEGKRFEESLIKLKD